MNEVTKYIYNKVLSAKEKQGFLDLLFSDKKKEVIEGKQVILFGAGAAGKEILTALSANNIFPVCFCDNDNSKIGNEYCGLPIISFYELKKRHLNALIIVASRKCCEFITNQLLTNGFNEDKVFCKYGETNTNLLFMYAEIGTQMLLADYKLHYESKDPIDVLMENERKMTDAYYSFADQKSKDLYISKIAVYLSNGNIELFKEFILTFSEPVLKFGVYKYDGTPEDYFYFNNDVLSLTEDEIYVDVGAFDGDTVKTFIETCKRNNISYKKIYTFEPDPISFSDMVKNTREYDNISHHNKGIWSETKTLRFQTSDLAIHNQAGSISNSGNIDMEVVSLDDFLKGASVTYIKMDPGGYIIPEALQGAAETIIKFKPKLALGAYQCFNAIFDIPCIVKSLAPDYKIYLRHNTYHLADTDLYATF